MMKRCFGLLLAALLVGGAPANAQTIPWSDMGSNVNVSYGGCAKIMGALGAGAATAAAGSKLTPGGRIADVLKGAGIFLGGILGWEAGDANCDQLNSLVNDFFNLTCYSDPECYMTAQQDKEYRWVLSISMDAAVCPSCTFQQLLTSAFMTTNERQQKMMDYQYANTGTATGAYVIPHSAYWSELSMTPMGHFWDGVSIGISGNSGGSGPAYDIE